MPQLVINLISSAGTPYQIELNLDPSWSHYWEQDEQNSDVLFKAILQHLADKVVNQAYVDNPHMKQTILDKIVWRPNHDVGHSLRQMFYVRILMKTLEAHGTPGAKATTATLSAQEYNALLLAAFLFRSGRTNEESSKSGLTQNNRSADIFRQVALGLGFNEELISSIAWFIEHYAPVNVKDSIKDLPFDGFTGTTEEAKDKALLVNGMLLLGHNTDLVRCWSNVEDIHSNNRDNLSVFFELDKVNSLEGFILDFARTACIWTGTNFYLHTDDSGEMFSSPSIYKRQAVTDCAASMRLLESNYHDWLPMFISLDPTMGNDLLRFAKELKLPQSYYAAQTIQRHYLANEAKRKMHQFLELDPYAQSQHSMASLKKYLFNKNNVPDEEQHAETPSVLTQKEQVLYDYLIEKFPWTLRHITTNLPAILESGFVRSSTDLQRTGISKSHTPDKYGLREYVFFTLSGPTADSADFLAGHRDTLELHPADFMEQDGTLSGPLGQLISTSPMDEHDTGTLKDFKVDGHLISVQYSKRSNEANLDSAVKTYAITRKDGTRQTYTVPYREEVVTGTNVIPFHALQLILLLRLIGGETRESCLSNPSSQLVHDLVNAFNHNRIKELLIPTRLPVHDHRIHFKRVADNIEVKKKQIQQMMWALNAEQPVDALQGLLEQGVPVDLDLENNESPLSWLIGSTSSNNHGNQWSKMMLLIEQGASLTMRRGPWMSVFSLAVLRGHQLIVRAMLERSLGQSIGQNNQDLVNINIDPAVFYACFNNDEGMLSLMEAHGLHYGALTYDIFVEMSEQPELNMLRLFNRLLGSRFPFEAQTKTAQDQACRALDALLKHNKYEILQKLIDKGLVHGAQNSSLFTGDLIRRINSCARITVPKHLTSSSTPKTQTAHLYLLTENGDVVLVKSQHHGCPSPYWHGIHGTLFEEINEKAIAELCLRRTSYRPQIARLEVIPGHEKDSCVVLVHLIPGSIPWISKTDYVADTRCQSLEQWKSDLLKEPINHLTQCVLNKKNITQALWSMKHLNACAIREHDEEIMRLIKQDVYDPEEGVFDKIIDKRTVNMALVNQLLGQGYSPNKTLVIEEQYYTPLILAMQLDNMALFQNLFKHGADPEQRIGLFGMSVVGAAAREGKLAYIQYLHEQGVNLKHPAHAPALALACMEHCTDSLFTYLLTHGDINASINGYTPLMIAAQYKKDDWIKALLENGAEQDIIHPQSLTKAKWLYSANLNLNRPEEQSWYENYQNYLKITGCYGATDLDERILREYQVTLVPDALDPLARQIQERLQLSEEITFGVAETGYHAVFACFGTHHPVIALQKDFLIHPQCTADMILFAVALHCKYHRHHQEHFTNPGIDDLYRYDNEVREELGLTISTIITYLQLAESMYQKFPDERFRWPPGIKTTQPLLPVYLDRVKKIRQHSVDSKDTKSSPLDVDMTRIRNAVTQVPLIRCFNDFPSEEAPDTQYLWFIEQLQYLAEADLLPYERNSIPSLHVKQYCALLTQYKESFSNEQLDELLRIAFDSKIPAYLELHGSLNSEKYISPENQVGGYFKDVLKTIEAFTQAKMYTEALNAADKLMFFYGKLHSVLASPDRAQDIYDHYEKALRLNTQPITRMFGINLEWERPAKKTLEEAQRISAKMHPWIMQQYSDNHDRLGNIWRALWVAGLWDGSCYDLIPEKEQTKFSSLSMNVSRAPAEDLLGPLVNPKNLDQYQVYYTQRILMRSASDTLSWEQKIVHFIARTKELLHRSDYYWDDQTKSLKQDLFAQSLRLELFTMINSFVYQQDSGHGPRYAERVRWVRELLFKPTSPLYGPVGFLENELVNYVLTCPFLSVEDKIFYHQNSMCNDNSFIEKVFPKEEETEKMAHYLRLIREYSNDFRYIELISKHYHEQIEELPITSIKLYQVLDWINQIPNKKAHNATISPWLKKIIWDPLFHDRDLTRLEFTRLYRILDVHFAFPHWDVAVAFRNAVLTRLQACSDFEEQQLMLIHLLSTSDGFDNSGMRLHDEHLIHECLFFLGEQSAIHFGLDNGSFTYAKKIMSFLAEWRKHLPANDYEVFLDIFSKKIQAQIRLCQHMHEENMASTVLPRYLVGLNIILNSIAQDEQDKYQFMDFLCSSITLQSLQENVAFIKGNKRLLNEIHKLNEPKAEEEFNDDQIAISLQLIHQQFWSTPLRLRIVATDALITPLSSEFNNEEKSKVQEANLKYILAKLFDDDQDEETSVASSLLISYFRTAHQEERQYLMAALLSVRKQEQGQQMTVGKKFAALLEHMGPAYIKLAQAIHSHPATPEGLRDDLKTVKGHAAPPYRWDLVMLLKKVLPESLFSQISSVGVVLGSASYHIAVSCLMNDGNSRVVLLTRPDAAKQAQKGFAHIERTIKDCEHPSVVAGRGTALTMLEEAKQMSMYELNHEIGDIQSALAQQLYSGQYLIKYQNKRHTVVFTPCQSYGSSPDYRLLEEMEGISFNQLPHGTTEEAHIRRVVAIAIMQKELTLILSGGYFDSDRHGEQLKIIVSAQSEQIHVGLFDFGEIGLEPLYEPQIQQVCAFLKELPAALKQNESITSVMERHIESASEQGKTYAHLIRMQKAFLALHDYIRVLEPELTLGDIVRQVLPEIHPKYREAIKQGFMNTLSIQENAQLFFKTIGAATGIVKEELPYVICQHSTKS